MWREQKNIIKDSEKDNLQAQINLAQHIETITANSKNHLDVNIKDIFTTRKKEQDKYHRDYVKEGVGNG